MKLSYSSICNYLNCPKKFYEVNVAYNWRDSSFAATAGTDIHKKIEDYITGATDVIEVPHDKRVADKLNACRWLYANADKANVRVGVERQFAIDADYNPVEWKSPKAILRGKLDLFIEDGKAFRITDWKSGKMRDNSLQAKIYKLLVSKFTTCKKITCSFDYLDKGIGDVYELTDSDVESTKQIVNAVLEAKDFPERRNPLCAWCPVKNCSYWKEQVKK